MTAADRGARPLRVGLTGNIGSGKSTVARLLASHGAAVIDADALAREATTDLDVLASIARALGDDLVLHEDDGSLRLDRGATAARVFADEDALATLNSIVHPWVRRRSARLLRELQMSPQPPQVVVQDIPLLYENGLQRDLDAVVVVDAPLETRVARVVARSGLEPTEVRRRDAAQMPLAEKVARADFVIDNSVDLTPGHSGDEAAVAALKEQVARLWRDLLAIER